MSAAYKCRALYFNNIKVCGSKGNAASALKVKEGLAFSKCSVLVHVEWMVSMILSPEEQGLLWPSEEKRKEISKRIFVESHLTCCVGFVNGTYLVLAFKPEQHEDKCWA